MQIKDSTPWICPAICYKHSNSHYQPISILVCLYWSELTETLNTELTSTKHYYL